MYALVDCNNFYASCERVFRPDLNGKPIVVLSNNDGCAIARSNEAKKLGIPMGAPAFEYEELFTKRNVHVFSANFQLYGDMSSRVMTLLSEFCPDVEIYSIDEAFLNLKGYDYYNLKEYATKIRKWVHKCTGIPISIGIAPTKALAKVANKVAKKFPEQTGGVHIIDSDELRIKALKWTQVEDVWGIGRQHSKRLHTMGVKNALQFSTMDDTWIKKHMAIVGLRLKRELCGQSVLEIDEVKDKKNISTTRSFEQNYTEFEQLQERVSTFAVSCAEKLRRQKTCCQSLMLFVHTNPHRHDLPQYSRNIVLPLPYATNSGIELSKFATMALKKIFKKGYHYKKAGVIVFNFIPETEKQWNIFENSNAKHIPLMKAVDVINTWYGQQKVRLASQDLKRIWKMKQERLSPKYTTKLSDIITINV